MRESKKVPTNKQIEMLYGQARDKYAQIGVDTERTATQEIVRGDFLDRVHIGLAWLDEIRAYEKQVLSKRCLAN